MTKLSTKSKRRGKTERSIVKHGLHRRELIRHQTMPCLVKLNANQKHRLAASNDANYYETANKEVQYACA
jgi:hypothetical protein